MISQTLESLTTVNLKIQKLCEQKETDKKGDQLKRRAVERDVGEPGFTLLSIFSELNILPEPSSRFRQKPTLFQAPHKTPVEHLLHVYLPNPRVYTGHNPLLHFPSRQAGSHIESGLGVQHLIR